jgi:hypothetical protein
MSRPPAPRTDAAPCPWRSSSPADARRREAHRMIGRRPRSPYRPPYPPKPPSRTLVPNPRRSSPHFRDPSSPRRRQDADAEDPRMTTRNATPAHRCGGA